MRCDALAPWFLPWYLREKIRDRSIRVTVYSPGPPPRWHHMRDSVGGHINRDIAVVDFFSFCVQTEKGQHSVPPGTGLTGWFGFTPLACGRPPCRHQPGQNTFLHFQPRDMRRLPLHVRGSFRDTLCRRLARVSASNPPRVMRATPVRDATPRGTHEGRCGRTHVCSQNPENLRGTPRHHHHSTRQTPHDWCSTAVAMLVARRAEDGSHYFPFVFQTLNFSQCRTFEV